MLKNIIEQAQKDGEYHFFMFYCKVLFPFSFAKHFRIVTVDKGIVTRIEVRHFKNDKNPDLGYIHINLLKPWAGLEKFLRKTNKHRKPNFAYHISGPKNSLAYKAVTFVNDNYLKYPHIYDYNFFVGPNCNTFIQRILNHIPEVKFKLPRNAIGKNHK